MKRIILASILGLSVSSGSAREADWRCWYDAAERYSLPPTLLYAIAHVESGNRINAVGHNRDGTYDIGVMQINSRHLPWLKKHGITLRHLMEDPCVNVHVGAYILRESIDRYGWNWRGLGAYNAGSDHKRAVYAKKVLTVYRRLFARTGQTNEVARKDM